MPDGIRSIDGDGLIPLPREILRAKRRQSRNGSQAEPDFEQALDSDETLLPQARRPRVAGKDQVPRADRKHEGLGGDLDLLA